MRWIQRGKSEKWEGLSPLSLGESEARGRARVREEARHSNTFSYGAQTLPHPQSLSPREREVKPLALGDIRKIALTDASLKLKMRH